MKKEKAIKKVKAASKKIEFRCGPVWAKKCKHELNAGC